MKIASYYVFPLAFIVFMGLLQLADTQLLRYSDTLMVQHEYWRLVTAHWVHLNILHWVLNSVGFVLLVALLKIRWKPSLWLMFIALLSVGISIAFLLLNPQLKWYVGFSGVLYGLYALAALVTIKTDTFMAISILALVIAKILLEQFFGEQMTSQSLLNAPVVIDAHAYGLVIGLLLGGLFLLIRKYTHETH